MIADMFRPLIAIIAVALTVAGCTSEKAPKRAIAPSQTRSAHAADLAQPEVEAAASHVVTLSRQSSRSSCPLGYLTAWIAAAGIAQRFPATDGPRSYVRQGPGLLACQISTPQDKYNGVTFIAAPSSQAIDANLGTGRSLVFGQPTPLSLGTLRTAPTDYGYGLGCDAMWTASSASLVIAVDENLRGANCKAELSAALPTIIRTLSTSR